MAETLELLNIKNHAQHQYVNAASKGPQSKPMRFNSKSNYSFIDLASDLFRFFFSHLGIDGVNK